MLFAKLPDFPNYRIYINGDIASEYKNGNVRKLKPYLDNRGYYIVGFHKDGKRKIFQLHRLLAMCFLPCNCNFSDVTVDHININPMDNRLCNLRWCDHSTQNLNQKYRETNTGFPFIYKCKHEKCKSGYSFSCLIKRNGKWILQNGRATLEDAVAFVREFLLFDPIAFEGLPRDCLLYTSPSPRDS